MGAKTLKLSRSTGSGYRIGIPVLLITDVAQYKNLASEEEQLSVSHN